MRGRYTAWLTLTMLVGSTGVATAQEGPLDYPQWRGANRDGAAAAFREPATWPTRLTRQWDVETGLGYATPILVGNRVYTFGRLDTDEVAMALDAARRSGRLAGGRGGRLHRRRRTSGHGSRPRCRPACGHRDRRARRGGRRVLHAAVLSARDRGHQRRPDRGGPRRGRRPGPAWRVRRDRPELERGRDDPGGAEGVSRRRQGARRHRPPDLHPQRVRHR